MFISCRLFSVHIDFLLDKDAVIKDEKYVFRGQKNLQNSRVDPKMVFPRFTTFPDKYDLQQFSLLFFEPMVIQITIYLHSNMNKMELDNYIQYLQSKPFLNNSYSQTYTEIKEFKA